MTKHSQLIYDWNNHQLDKAEKPDFKIEIHDETLRDGLQSPSITIPTLEQKIKIIECMEQLGIDSVLVGFPAISDLVKKETKCCIDFIKRNKLKIKPVCAARTLKKDIDDVADISQAIGEKIDINIFLGASSIRSLVENWTFDNLLKKTSNTISYAVSKNLNPIFITEDTTRTHPDEIKSLYLSAIQSGAERLCVTDTVGYATPKGVYSIIKYIRDLLDSNGHGRVGVDFHGHNDRGMSLSNSLEAIKAGANRIHACSLSLGERSGNTSMEQLLVNLKLLGWIDNDLTSILNYSKAISECLDVPIPYNHPIIGADSFKTVSGIHASAILKALEMNDELLADIIYNGIPASMVGRKIEIAINQMSGRANVIHWLKKNKLPIRDDHINKILDEAKSSNSMISNDELISIFNK